MFRTQSEVRAVAFSDDDKQVICASTDGTTNVWNAIDDRIILSNRPYVPSERMSPVVLSRGGKYVAFGTGVQQNQNGGVLRIYDVLHGLEIESYRGHLSAVECAAFSPNCKLVASGSMTESKADLKLWGLPTGKGGCVIRTSLGGSQGIDFSFDGTQVIVSGYRSLAAHDARSGKMLRSAKTNGQIYGGSVSCSPDGKTCVTSGGETGIVAIRDFQTLDEIRNLKGHSKSVLQVLYSPNGGWIATGSEDQTVRIWDVQSAGNIHVLRGHAGPILTVAFSPDGRQIASGDTEGVVRIWDVEKGIEIRTLKAHTDRVYSLAFSPDGKHFASSSPDGTFKFWNPITGESVQTINAGVGFRTIVFSPDSKRLISAGLSGEVTFWDPFSGREVFSFKTNHSGRSMIVVSQDGRLARGSGTNEVHIWDMSPTGIDGR